MEKQSITEKDGIHEQWYKDAKEQTLKTLPEFLRHVLDDYGHDYGTICHALAAGAVATTHAMNTSPHGGITGFQAGCIMWSYMMHWNHVEPPAKLVIFKDMLFPQYQEKFEKTIAKETWDYLQEEAKKNLEITKEPVSPVIMAHWKSIAQGKIPFGYVLGGSN